MAHPKFPVAIFMFLFFYCLLIYTPASAQTLPCTPTANGSFSLQSSALLASSNETLTLFLDFAPTVKQGSYVTKVQVTLGTQQVFAYNATSQLNESTIALNWGSPTDPTAQATFNIENNMIMGTFDNRPLKPLVDITAASPEVAFADGAPLPTAQLLPADIDAQDFNTTIQQLATIVSNAAKNCANPTLPSNVTTRGMPLDGSNLLFRREVAAHYSNPSTLFSCIACNQGVMIQWSAMETGCVAVCGATAGFYCQKCFSDATNWKNQELFNCATGGSCCPLNCGDAAGGYFDCCFSTESCAGNRSGKCCAGNSLTNPFAPPEFTPCNGQLCCDPNAGESCFLPVDDPSSATCTCPEAQQCKEEDGNPGNGHSSFWTYNYCCPSGTFCANIDANLCCPTDQVGCGTSKCCPAAAGCADPTTGQCCPTDTVSCGTTCCKDGFCANAATSQCCPTDSQACGPTCCTGGSYCADASIGICCPAGTVSLDDICCPTGDILCVGKCCKGACCGDFCYPGWTKCPAPVTCLKQCEVATNCGEGYACNDGCCFKIME